VNGDKVHGAGDLAAAKFHRELVPGTNIQAVPSVSRSTYKCQLFDFVAYSGNSGLFNREKARCIAVNSARRAGNPRRLTNGAVRWLP